MTAGRVGPPSRWFRDTPESRRMLAEEVEALTSKEETLVDFLFSRIAEAENWATTGRADYLTVWMLDDCLAKRRIIGRITDGCPHGLAAPTVAHPSRRVYPGGWCLEHCEAILRELALPYAENPDYRQDWKP